MTFLHSRQFSLLFLILISLLLYWPGLNGAFFFDDIANIVDSSEVQMREFSLHALSMAWEGGVSGPLGRPISMISFALNYYFADFSPFWFKLTNVAIHCFNAVLVYFFLQQIGGIFFRNQTASILHPVSIFLAMLWACHPIQLTSVLYVVQRMTSLSSLFVLLALIFHIQGRQNWTGRKSAIALICAWFIFFPLSLLCKETGVLFVGYAFAYELIIRCHLYVRYDRPGLIFVVGFSAIAFVLSMYFLFFSSWLWDGFAGRPYTLTERVLTESRVIWKYVGLLLAPSLSKFALYHDDIGLSVGFFSPLSTLYSILGLGFLVVIAPFLVKKAPLLAFAIIWFLIGHSLESTVIPLELMHEHRNYLPSLGVIFIFMQLASSVASVHRNVKFLIFSAGIGFVGYCAVLTYLRADMFGDDVRRTQIEAGYHERSARSQYDAGALLVNFYNLQPNPNLIPLANKYFKATNAIDPGFKMALVSMLQLECLAYKTANEEIVRELAQRLSIGVVAAHERTTMNGIAKSINSGTLCLSRSQVDKLFSSILSNPMARNSDKARIWNRYAMYLWLGQNDYVAALKALKESFALGDTDPVNRLNAIQLMRVLGDNAGVLRMLDDVESRKLTALERSNLSDLKKDLIADGILPSRSE